MLVVPVAVIDGTLESGVVHEEDVARRCVELVFRHTRLGAAHRLHHAEAGDLRRATDERDLARALDAAHPVENRIQVPDVGASIARAEQLDEAPLARDTAVPVVVHPGGLR